MAMAISYNWLFLWDYTIYKWGDLVLINGISGHNCRRIFCDVVLAWACLYFLLGGKQRAVVYRCLYIALLLFWM